jgi:hypothetical protein
MLRRSDVTVWGVQRKRDLRGIMQESYEKAFELVIGLEGVSSNDPRDPGGETKYGIAKRYHPNLDIKNLTLEQAKEIYLNEYWIPSGCEDAPYPMDICLFDSAVNPQKGGNKGLLDQHPGNWQDYNILRMIRYMNNSKPEYVKGHIFRVLRLSQKLREG